MTEQDVRALALSFPEVGEGLSYGQPAFKVAGKFFTRIRAEDDSLVLTGVDFDEREIYIAAEPEVFHIPDHYRNHPTILARIARVDPGTVKVLLERRWRSIAPKRLVKAWDTGQFGHGARWIGAGRAL
jgi:hypothetical protein